MKYASLLLAVILSATVVFANPPASNNLTQPIPGTKSYYGITNFKMVMPGTLYRGGSVNSRVPLPASSLQKLCKEGFSTAVYVYSRDWHGNMSRQIKCGGSEINYLMRLWDRPNQVHEILKKLHHLIVTEKGPMYVHCWYGMHASGYVATTALMQFCNLSPRQGVAYWNSNVPQKLQYSKVQNMIRNFKPDAALQLAPAQQARVCPNRTMLDKILAE